MSTQFEEPFFPEQAREILEQLVVFTGRGTISHADRERVDQAITKIIEAHAAAALDEQVKLLERLKAGLPDPDDDSQFSKNGDGGWHTPTYQIAVADFMVDIDRELSALKAQQGEVGKNE